MSPIWNDLKDQIKTNYCNYIFILLIVNLQVNKTLLTNSFLQLKFAMTNGCNSNLFYLLLQANMAGNFLLNYDNLQGTYYITNMYRPYFELSTILFFDN